MMPDSLTSKRALCNGDTNIFLDGISRAATESYRCSNSAVSEVSMSNVKVTLPISDAVSFCASSLCSMRHNNMQRGTGVLK